MHMFYDLLACIGIGFILFIIQCCHLSGAKEKLQQAQHYSLVIHQRALARDLERLGSLLDTEEGTPSLLQFQVEWRLLGK